MALILDLDLDLLKMHLYTENEVSRSRHLKVGHTDRQTCICNCKRTHYLATFAGGNKNNSVFEPFTNQVLNTMTM